MYCCIYLSGDEYTFSRTATGGEMAKKRNSLLFKSTFKNMYQNKIKGAETVQSRAHIKLANFSLEVAIQFVSFLGNNKAKSCVSNTYPENYTMYSNAFQKAVFPY